MKIAIIGAGNMGGAIARGLAHGQYIDAGSITVSNPSNAKLEKLKEEYPDINITNNNKEAADGADIVILAVKPWKMEEVLKPLRLRQPQILVSSLTLIASRNASAEQTDMMIKLFNEMGVAILIEEKLFPAGTSLTSCGIAYVLKYVQAAMQAGIELGFKPKEAKKMIAQTMLGAAQILLNDEDSHPATEIEKVTTPGGITIKGLNRLEHDGFTSAVINAIKESCI